MAAAMWSGCRKVPVKLSWLRRSHCIQKQLTHCLFSTQVVQVEECVEYPPIKPRYPPGEWGYMTPSQAWGWQNEMDEVRETTTVRERLKKLCDIPDRPIWKVNPLTAEPYHLPYQQFLTKTHLIKGLPELYGSMDVDEQLETLRPIVIDTILYEDGAVHRKENASNRINAGPAHEIVGQLLHTLIGLLSGENEYLLQGQFDENVRVAAHWKRHGIPQKGRQHPKFPRPQNAPFQIDHVAHYQIRVENPLNPFLPREAEFCRTVDYPEHDYNPVVMGLKSNFTSPSIVAGHWPEDSCHFGLLSAHITNNYVMDKLEPKFGDALMRDIRTGYGLLSSFAWQVALAHYQGFSMYHDLTFPLCGQTILSNGKRFAFMTYQLNTLHLWKDDQSNPLRNICWYSEDMNLYETVENGEVKGFNDDVLRTILRFLLNKPGSDNMDLKPMFGDGFVSPVRPWPYIADKPPPPPPEEEQPLYVQ